MDKQRLSIAALIALAVGSGCASAPREATPGPQAYWETDMAKMAEREVLAVLDELHAAAAKADESVYFALYAPEAVFIGTDAGERWTKEEFRAYAAPHFSQGKGWTYKPRAGTRHVTILPGAGDEIAFFDELLDNEKYGTCRGTGMLRRIKGAWHVCQYHLTFPVPNEMAERITTEIRAFERR